ncbi:MAG TPA: hypothetical protein VF530_05675 [Planctomycetota bacterium]
MVRRNDDESPPRARSSAGATSRPTASPGDEILRHLARLTGLRGARRELCELACRTLTLLAREERHAAAALRRALLDASEQAFATETLRRLVRERPDLALEEGLGALLGLVDALEPLDPFDPGHDRLPLDHEESP